MGFRIKNRRLYCKVPPRKVDIAPVKVQGNKYLRYTINYVTKQKMTDLDKAIGTGIGVGAGLVVTGSILKRFNRLSRVRRIRRVKRRKK